MGSVYGVLSQRPGSVRLLDWIYRGHVDVFRRACAASPRQGRRAGPAPTAPRAFVPEQVMKRGRWQALNRARRYEKTGRVNRAWGELIRGGQGRVAQCLRSLDRATLQYEPAPRPPWARGGIDPAF